ncbi:hypothetical protein JL721_10795 [Aureococcus anophagefferens]|nr:hypothetical protein JL721_10795 [Aureococcus anophagefferens]
MNPASRKFDPEKSILNQRAVDAERSAEAANARLALEVERSTALRAESDRRDRAAQAERRRLEAANRASRDAIARCEAELSAAAASAETEREKATALRVELAAAAPFRDEASAVAKKLREVEAASAAHEARWIADRERAEAAFAEAAELAGEALTARRRGAATRARAEPRAARRGEGKVAALERSADDRAAAVGALEAKCERLAKRADARGDDDAGRRVATSRRHAAGSARRSPASRRGSRRSGRRPDGRRSTAPPRGGRDAGGRAGVSGATARADRAEAELAQARARIVLEALAEYDCSFSAGEGAVVRASSALDAVLEDPRADVRAAETYGSEHLKSTLPYAADDGPSNNNAYLSARAADDVPPSPVSVAPGVDGAHRHKRSPRDARDRDEALTTTTRAAENATTATAGLF